MKFFFSAVRALSQKFGVTQHTQHRLYSHNTFFLQMSQIPERSRSKTSTALTVLYNLLHPGSSTSSPPTIRLHSLLSFTHSLASGMLKFYLIQVKKTFRKKKRIDVIPILHRNTELEGREWKEFSPYG